MRNMVKIIPKRITQRKHGSYRAVIVGGRFLVTRNGVPVAELRPSWAARRSYLPKAELVGLSGLDTSISKCSEQILIVSPTRSCDIGWPKRFISRQ